MMQLAPDISTFSVLAIGFVLGLRHATEADHLAAVSTIVSERKSLFTASIVGGLWGVGHTISLFAVGLLVVFLKLQISTAVEAKLEAGVGLMLVILGVNALRKLLRSEKIHAHTHEHDVNSGRLIVIETLPHHFPRQNVQQIGRASCRERV